jgi:hypothetical protein
VNVADIFRHDIRRRIEEVIKVDFGDEVAVARELDEYVVTDHLREAIEEILDRYQETINKPDEGVTVWVSGFFGSGKSSLAKNVGYLLNNPDVGGVPAAERLLARVQGDRVRALLHTIHAQAPTLAIFVDLSSSRNVLKEGEHPVLPLYRALLERLDYSRDLALANLEFDLETDDALGDFERAFAKVSGDRGDWRARRNIGLARHEASHAMHVLRPDTFPSPDSWARGAPALHVDAGAFSERALEMLARRAPGTARITFVVDEVGQYVARDRQRMLDLQGIAHAFQKRRGNLWLIATSQETLEDVIDSLEGSKVELARVQDRFPVRVDLLPSDIEEVTSRRVLEKSAEGAAAVREVADACWNKLQSHTLLASPRRDTEFSRDELVRLYPLVPYQIQLFIDAVSAHRARTGAQPMLGGSNRTIIKLAQQLVVDRQVALGDAPVGALATADMAYDLLAGVVPTPWQAEVDHVAEREGRGALTTRVAKAVALLSGVAWLRLDAANLAVLLHPGIDAESLGHEVRQALAALVEAEVLRQADEGYRLQSPEEKDWEKDRRSVAMSPAAYRKLRREAIKEALGAVVASAARSFPVALDIEGDKGAEGDVRLVVEEAERADDEALRARSREAAAEGSVYWSYEPSDDTYRLAREVHRSREMISRRESSARSGTDFELMGEERAKLGRAKERLVRSVGTDLLAGWLFFRGVRDAVSGNDARSAAVSVMSERIPAIFPRLSTFAAPVKRGDALALLRADGLDGLPATLGDDGLGLVRTTPRGHELAADQPPLSLVVEEIRSRADYGREASGEHLERHFRRPPYGASIEAVQVVVAAAIRAGLVEARYQAARIASARDKRLEKVFATIPAFRATTFAPQRELDIEVRARVANRLAELTGEAPPLAVEELAATARTVFGPDAGSCQRVAARLQALGLAVPATVSRAQALIAELMAAADDDVVKTTDETWSDLVAGRDLGRRLDIALDDEALVSLRLALDEVRRGTKGLNEPSVAAATELADVLAAADLDGNLGRIRDLVGKVTRGRADAWRAASDELQAAVDAELSRLRARSLVGAEDVAATEALRALSDLVPPDDADATTGPSLDALAARLQALPGVADQVIEALRAATAGTEVVHVRVRDLFDGVVASPDDLDTLLTRIRAAAEEALAEGKGFSLS